MPQDVANKKAGSSSKVNTGDKAPGREKSLNSSSSTKLSIDNPLDAGVAFRENIARKNLCTAYNALRQMPIGIMARENGKIVIKCTDIIANCYNKIVEETIHNLAKEARSESSTTTHFTVPVEQDIINKIRKRLDVPVMQSATFNELEVYYAPRTPTDRRVLINTTLTQNALDYHEQLDSKNEKTAAETAVLLKKAKGHQNAGSDTPPAPGPSKVTLEKEKARAAALDLTESNSNVEEREKTPQSRDQMPAMESDFYYPSSYDNEGAISIFTPKASPSNVASVEEENEKEYCDSQNGLTNLSNSEAASLLPIVPPNAMDFASLVHGVELSEHAPVIVWPGGIKTVVPFIPKDDNTKKNVLELDEDAVKRFATLAHDGPHNFVQTLETKKFSKIDLEARIRAELGRGNTVVITGIEKPELLDFSEATVIKERGLSCHKLYDLHDPVERLEDFTNPQVSACLSEFFTRLKDPKSIAYILDIPSSIGLSPVVICQLDDGKLARAGLSDWTSTNIKPYADTDNTRNWDLLHGAGAHTLEHHDAEGYCTFVWIKIGCKIWGIVRPKGYTKAETRAKLDELNKMFIRPGWRGKLPKSWKLEWEKSGGKVHAIVARPGDLVIMPPGTWHLVYTPVRTLASGGHIFTYDTMHLTEASRLFDKSHALEVTNTSHVSAFETLCFMLLNVIRLDDRVFHWKPLLALCRMVLNFQDYIAQAPDKDNAAAVLITAGEPIPELAKVIARQITLHLGMDIEDEEYLFQHGLWMDPGPAVDLTAVFQEWEGTPFRPGNLKPEEFLCTLGEILDRQWLPPSLHAENNSQLQPKSSTSQTNKITNTNAKKRPPTSIAIPKSKRMKKQG